MLKKKFQLNEIVDNYTFKIVRKIADGGMGSVYEAIQFGSEGFQKVVALKIISEKLSREREFVEMFIGEAKLVADLVHQNIVQIYQLGSFRGLYYIAMEYVEGVNLQEFLHKHFEIGIKVPLEIALFIISRVCRGLEYAHRKTDRNGVPLGIVHRDVSPKNILINTEGNVKITDFGIAKARKYMKDLEGEVLMGKAQYMSPEQANYMPTDKRSDIFSLGVVTYELITGLSLFGDEKTQVILDNVISKPIPKLKLINQDIPDEIEKIVTKMLERDLKKRYQDVSQLVYDIEYFMYHDRYGPTYMTLEKYMRQLFPELFKNTIPMQEERFPDYGLKNFR